MAMRMPPRRTVLRLALAAAALLIALAYYLRTHPLVFNESFVSHAHCMKAVGLAFWMYAADCDGHFPSHADGYGDALLILARSYGSYLPHLTGPGYGLEAFREALTSGGDVDEVRCGRVYIQGLTARNDPQLALLFDKAVSPGDHRHLLARLVARPGREVWLIGEGLTFIPQGDWPEFARRQVELLVAAGFRRGEAEQLYRPEPPH
jgi:hypothetical protein